MTLDLSQLKGAGAFNTNLFFHENTGLHPNILVSEKSHDAIQALLDTGAVNGHTSYLDCETTGLYTSISEKNITALGLFLDHEGTNPDIKNHEGSTLLHWAILNASVEASKTLIKHPRIDLNALNKNGLAPLHIAVGLSQDNSEIARQLCESPRVELNKQDTNGYTALHWAVITENYNSVDLLIKSGRVDPSIKDKKGYTPLEHAYLLKDSKISERLNSYLTYISTIQDLKDNPKSNPSERDTSDLAPLHWAVANDDVEAVKKLLAEGIKITKTVTGYTPLDYVKATGNDVIAKLLADYLLSIKEVAQKVNECRDLVLYTGPTVATTTLATKYSLLSRSIEESLSKTQFPHSAAKVITLDLTSFLPPQREALLSITNGDKYLLEETPEPKPLKPTTTCRLLELDKNKNALNLPPHPTDTKKGTVTPQTPIGTVLKNGAKNAAWFTCRTALYALATIPTLALATKLYFVAQGFFDSQMLQGDCLAASEDTRSFVGSLFYSAPQSYADCMSAGI